MFQLLLEKDRSCTQYPISNFVSYDSLSPSYRTFFSFLNSVSIPQGWKEAINDPKWKDVMVEEMKALAKNETWELVDLPFGKKNPWDVNGYSQLSIRQTALLKD